MPQAEREAPAPAARLAGRWYRLWHQLAAAGREGDARTVFEQLVRCYASPGRHYHTLVHVERCLQDLDEARHLTGRPDLVEAALWFHDCVYDPRRSDNEERSAAVASDALARLGVPPADRAAVTHLILATRHTRPADAEAAGDLACGERLIADVDLAILGAPAAQYDAYERAIRREYAYVPDEAFRAGRAALLRGFLTRPMIFATAHHRQRYEQRARRNLAQSLVRLAS